MEEVVDIDLSDPEVKKAAIFIQTGFKGFKAKRNQSTSTTSVSKNTTDLRQNRTLAGFTNLGISDNENGDKQELMASGVSDGFSEPGISETNSAVETGKDGFSKPEISGAGIQSSTAEVEEEVVDIDLTDPEVKKAAVFIQAGFKGFKAKKKQQTSE